jgi:hypothetical protein
VDGPERGASRLHLADYYEGREMISWIYAGMPLLLLYLHVFLADVMAAYRVFDRKTGYII